MVADYPALGLLEFASLAVGIEAGDAMVKRAPVAHLWSGTIQPGYYLNLVIGDVASVEEALAFGKETREDDLRDQLFLPNVHPDVVAALKGQQQVTWPALGVVETVTVSAAIRAADAGMKGAEVTLWQLRLGDGLGGKGVVLFMGLVADVATAVDIGVQSAGSALLHQAVIAQLHDEMRQNLVGNGRFGTHYEWEAT